MSALPHPSRSDEWLSRRAALKTVAAGSAEHLLTTDCLSRREQPRISTRPNCPRVADQTGAAFRAKWASGGAWFSLFNVISRTMPVNAAGSLSPGTTRHSSPSCSERVAIPLVRLSSLPIPMPGRRLSCRPAK
jgi:hypothetical protein